LVAMRWTDAPGAGSESRRPSSSWGSPTSAVNPDGANSSLNGEPGVIACGQSSRRSRRNCDGGCISSRTGTMAGASGEGLLRVSRRADQLPGIARLPSPRHGLMAAHATAPQPEGSHDVAADREDRIRLSPAANNPSSVAADALCRHTPKVGAACGNSARAVLCGGRSERPSLVRCGLLSK